MSISIKKMIYQRDHGDYYENIEFLLDEVVQFPYVAGEFQSLVPENSQVNKKNTRLIRKPLFNKAGLTKRIINIEPSGLYFLELLPGYKLGHVYVEPEEIIMDIFHGGNAKTLIYSFYNPTNRNTISITASSEKDSENIFNKIYSNPTDVILRQYFIKKSLKDSALDSNQIISPNYPELMTAAQIAEYLQVKLKTIRNWTSKGIIPFRKIGGATRYPKSEIDGWKKGSRYNRK